MQDKSIAAIGEWQLEKMKLENTELVDMYIENMFPDKDYQMLLIVFKITEIHNVLHCEYKGIDIEKVSAENNNYRKYAYRKGSSRGGDVTFSTKISLPIDKKIKSIKETTFKNIIKFKSKETHDKGIFELLYNCFNEDNLEIERDIVEILNGYSKDDLMSTGLSFKVIKFDVDYFLRDFDIIRENIIASASITNYTHTGTESKSKNKLCSVSGVKSQEVYGFAAPFKFSSPDKLGFISGFFNKKLNWRNYPISKDETLVLELGRKYAQQYLTSYFYGNEYMIIPHPIIKTNQDDLEKIINLLKTAFENEKQAKKEKKQKAEDRVQKIIANEKNYFNIDIVFFKVDKKTGAISINLMLEEILPSRFRELFIDVPEKINQNKLFKNAIIIKKEVQNLTFSFQIIKNFFSNSFLDVVKKIFIGNQISVDFVFENFIYVVQKNYNAAKTTEGWVEPTNWTIIKAIMLINYLQELRIIDCNQNYKYMEIENTQKKESSFKLDTFNEFVNENSNFLDCDIKVGVFSIGVLTRFLFDIQSVNLNNTPFENKLRGYKLSPELLMQVYTEALDKIQKYQKNFYVYTELREIINRYFVLKTQELKKMTNNEISFYFVAGLEMGRKFKREKEKLTDNQ